MKASAMNRSDFESMGDRQKLFEGLEANRKLLPTAPTLVRLDGRAFHTFCRGLAKPFDVRLSRAMVETAKYLVEKTQACVAYTQSDEISLAFPNRDLASPLLFDGRAQKLCSILAAMTTAKFNQEIAKRLPEKAHLLPVFDARVWVVPSLELAAEHFLWREVDATRNSLTMAAQACYSHKELQGVGAAQKHELLRAKGINWNDYPDSFKRGTFVRRETVLKSLSDEELRRIPAAKRPQGPVVRTAVTERHLPPLSRVTNLVNALFQGEPATTQPAEALLAA